LLSSQRWTGTHPALGRFAAHGPSFAPGARLRPARGLDLAPTVLHLLGLPAGADMPGRVLTESFAPASPAGRRAVALAPSYDGRVSRRYGPQNPVRQQAIEERLRALGYIR